MNEADFEVSATLRARTLRVHVPPDTSTRPETLGVELDTDGSRTSLPSKVKRGETYPRVTIHKSVVGRVPVQRPRQKDSDNLEE